MIRNYLKIAWRNITKNKLFSVINMLGLAIGVATFFLIMLFVADELKFDRFNRRADDIARIIFKANINGGKISEASVMAPVAATMKKDFPEVEDATRLVNAGAPRVRVGGKQYKGDRLARVDPNFLTIFTLPMISGVPGKALLNPDEVVLTKSAAEKYFGREPALGKTIEIDGNKNYIVSGVIEDVPRTSHFHFEIFGSLTGMKEASSDSWMLGSFYTYLLLKPGTDPAKLETRFPQMVATYMGPQILSQMGVTLDQFRTKGNELGFAMQRLTDIHLKSATTNEIEPGGNAAYVYIFTLVACFMLLVAGINFVNLSTAGASKRAREVGVRKVIGSEKGQLVGQFLSESFLTTTIACTIAAVLLWLLLPLFGALSGKSLTLNLESWLVFLLMGTVVGLVAGIYPAFYLSAFKPVEVLKGRLMNRPGKIGLRNGLVVFQFFVSVCLVVGTIVTYQQMKYIQKKDIGYSREQLLIIPNSYALGKNERAFKQQMLQDTRIKGATMSWFKPVGPTNFNNAFAYTREDHNKFVNGVNYQVDEDYIPVMAMKVLRGRNFSPDFPTDTLGIILNETAVTALGWNVDNVIGQDVVIQNSNRGNSVDSPYHVIGVIKNFHFKSLHNAISPLFMTLDPQGGLIFKLNTADVEGVLGDMKQKWENFQAEDPFTYAFMDELFEKTYDAEQKTARVLNIFAVLTIFVACLGLFGLATFASELRTKEIGIRKVLGASVGQVIGMLSRDFLKWVSLGAMIAFPVAWWAMSRWLENFAYRIEISWWMFAAAGVVSIAIALLTVSFQAIKAAVSSPVKALRTE